MKLTKYLIIPCIAIGMVLSIFSCKSGKKNYPLNGYYYATTSAEIYHFDKNKIFHYNFLDSITNTYKLNVAYLQFGDNKFEYQSNNDSIIIYNFYKEQNLVLKKFEFKDFNIVDLIGSEWKVPQKNKNDSVNFFSRFHDSKTIYNFSKTDKYIWAHMMLSDYQTGIFFNKFYVFSSAGAPYIIASYSEDEILYLVLGQKNRFNEVRLKYVPYKNLDSTILGKWIKTNDTLKRNDMTYFSYLNGLTGITRRSLDSIKREYGYDSIEFTKDNYFINYSKTKNKVKKNRIRLDYDPQTNLIFLEGVNYENDFLKMELLSKDTIRIHFPEPDLLFTYRRYK